jgi:ATP-dependent Clp protease ATP-binding subunit ClpB
MDPSHLTQKSTEALHDAQAKALRLGHTEVDGEHLLLALLDQQDGIVPRLLAQAGADPDSPSGRAAGGCCGRSSPRMRSPGSFRAGPASRWPGCKKASGKSCWRWTRSCRNG